jgi:5,10-methylene-tetrahydrofolate dehydrogenase/methenyl tetrahydrofolate cyclohydrolase
MGNNSSFVKLLLVVVVVVGQVEVVGQGLVRMYTNVNCQSNLCSRTCCQDSG